MGKGGDPSGFWRGKKKKAKINEAEKPQKENQGQEDKLQHAFRDNQTS